MIEQKSFSVVDEKPEEQYLNEKAQQGYLFEKVTQEGYHFIEQPNNKKYIVEFYTHENQFDESVYTQQGLELVQKYITEKGYWYYLSYEGQEREFKRNYQGRITLARNSTKKLEVFTLVLTGFVLLFCIYKLITDGFNWYIGFLTLSAVVSFIIMFKTYMVINRYIKYMEDSTL